MSEPLKKVERKYLAHFIDAAFSKESPNYTRLGKDLEDYSEALNPDVETKKNIIGESSTNVKGYAPQGTVEPYYAYEGDPLYEHLDTIINARATGSSLNTTVVDVQIDSTGKIKWAYREDAVVVPQSRGGSDGVQIPFEIYYNGNRTEGTFALATKSFTPKTNNES